MDLILYVSRVNVTKFWRKECMKVKLTDPEMFNFLTLKNVVTIIKGKI